MRQTDHLSEDLVRPQGSLGFGMDALVLSAFTASMIGSMSTLGMKNPLRAQAFGLSASGLAVMELGCGTGVALASLLRQVPTMKGEGVDISPELIEAARTNVRILGLEDRMACRTVDISSFSGSDRPYCDVVMTNPPYWEEGTGKGSQHRLDDVARRGRNSVATFCRAARNVLVHHGYLYVIYPASRLQDLMQALAASNLGLRRMRFLRSLADRPAIRVLCEARKFASDDVQVLPDIVLYQQGPDGTNVLTQGALAFCPSLA